MLEVLGIVVLIVLIGASIAWHELGHLIPAKRFGVKVTQYMIGFGPTMWSSHKGETEYGLKAVPLGGYIRMIGMIPPAKDGTQRQVTTGWFSTIIAQTRESAAAEIEPGDENRLFYKLPVPKRIVIMLGGPVMNLILAFVLFAVVLVGIGIPEPTLQVNSVVACTPTVSQPSGLPLPSGACPEGSEASPAVAAGMQPGDVITAVNGMAASSWDEVSAWIREHGGTQTTITVDRGGASVDLPVQLATAERPVVDDAGEATGESVQAGFLGVRPGSQYVGQPLSSVPGFMWDITTMSVSALISLPVRLWDLVSQTLIGGGDRSLDSPVSVVGVSMLGGEIAAMDEPFLAKAASILGLVASLNLFLALFNLVPILPLDGGHVAGALYEGVRRKFAALRGRPDPGPVDIARMMPIAYLAAGVLIVMGVIVIWADIVKPISLG